MSKILYIVNYDLEKNEMVGSFLMEYRNLKILEEVFGKRQVELFYIKDKKTNRIERMLNYIFNYNEVLDRNEEKKIIKKIRSERYDYIFISTSTIGKIIPKIKKIQPQSKIITFFHNAEYRYYEGFLNEIYRDKCLKSKLIKYHPLLKTCKYNEKRALYDSDISIALNKRDSLELKNIYGKEATIILPMAVEDKYIVDESKVEKDEIEEKEKYMLFIGSYFYGNTEGIKWFCKEVMPYVKIKLKIVGKGMEKLKDELLERENIEIIGFVESLEKCYLDSQFVVLPIISGSGMKTKTAEALMYGKSIIGTKEAFEGYDLDYEKVGAICNSSKEFIDKINSYSKEKKNKFNEYSRSFFLQNHTYQSNSKKLKENLSLLEGKKE